MMVRKRKRHGNLTIVLLAQLTTILPCNPDRMPPLLRKASIIEDPSFDLSVAFDARQHQFTDLGQHLLIRPVTLTDKMQQRLMLRRRPLRSRYRRHRLDTLVM